MEHQSPLLALSVAESRVQIDVLKCINCTSYASHLSISICLSISLPPILVFLSNFSCTAIISLGICLLIFIRLMNKTLVEIQTVPILINNTVKLKNTAFHPSHLTLTCNIYESKNIFFNTLQHVLITHNTLCLQKARKPPPLPLLVKPPLKSTADRRRDYGSKPNPCFSTAVIALYRELLVRSHLNKQARIH